MGGCSKKEYLSLNGRPLIQSVIYSFLETRLFARLILVVPEGGEPEATVALGEIPKQLHDRNAPGIDVVAGGSTRQRSVLCGLQAALSYDPDLVLIHDGARPWITPRLIERVVDVATKFGAAAPVVKIVDSVKHVDSDGNIDRHVDRETLVGIQTPQGFHYPKILHAHRAALEDGYACNDDTELYHRYCGVVRTVEGEPQNRKVTFASDLGSSGV